MLALRQGQQQVVCDAAGPRRAPGGAASPRRGGRRLWTAGRAGGAEVVRGVRALGEARALGRHRRPVVRVQQAFGRGAPGGREQQGRAAGLRGAAHGRAHRTDPHPVPGRDGPGFVGPGIRAGRRCGLGAGAATYSSGRDGLCRRSSAQPPRGARQEPLPGARVARGKHAGGASGGSRGRLGSRDLRGHRLGAPGRRRPPLLLSRPPTVPEAEAAEAGVPEVRSREGRIPQARRSRGANALPKARSPGEKAGATFPRRSGSCALLGSRRVCERARRARRE